MAKEFNVPPVVFPSVGGGTLQQRRTTTSSNPSIPFSDSSSAVPSFLGEITYNFDDDDDNDDEPPLLEELGINTRQIWSKTVSLLNPFRVKAAHLHEDADLSGPFLLVFGFGLFQLLAGKIHMGIIFGWITVNAIFLYVVFKMLGLAGRNGNLNLRRCLSLTGYSMLPMVILSALALFLPQGGPIIFAVAGLFVLWSTRVCTSLLVKLAAVGDDHRGLVSYACFLIYALFSLLVIF